MRKSLNKQKKKKYFSYEKGVTRLTLLFIIIVILVIAGTIGFLVYSKSTKSVQSSNTNEGIIDEITVNNSSNNTVDNDSKNDGGEEIENNVMQNQIDTSEENVKTNGEWIQDKTKVKCGDITLEVGSQIEGYRANEINKWYVLGVEDGKLLITTYKGTDYKELNGENGYENGIDVLDKKMKEIYDDKKLAENVRTINADDLNRISGFEPSSFNYYGKEYSYKCNQEIEADEKFYDGEKKISWSEVDSVTLKNTYYKYDFMGKIDKDCEIQSLFKEIMNNRNSFWLGTSTIKCSKSKVNFGIGYVSQGELNFNSLVDSKGNENNDEHSVLPVVILKSSIKVGSDGKISSNNEDEENQISRNNEKSRIFGEVNEDYVSQIGYKVTGYNSAKGENWRLLYVDRENAYLIADLIEDINLEELPGYAEQPVSELGKKLNSEFKDWNSDNSKESIDALCLLLNSDKWEDYKTSYANWAIGSPTIELFIASYNATHTEKMKKEDKSIIPQKLDCKVESTGYKLKKNSESVFSNDINGLGTVAKIDSAIYCGGAESWLIASPSARGSWDLMEVGLDSIEANMIYGEEKIRPVVSIPLTEFEDKITITDSYMD